MSKRKDIIVGDPEKGTALTWLGPEFKSQLEELLPRLVNTLVRQNNHMMRKAIIKKSAETLGIAAESLSKIVTRYRLTELKNKRNIPYYHYHQTSLSNFQNALKSEEQALLSMNEQKKRGATFTSQGSRPDIVQFTTDDVDADGNLRKSAIQSVGATGTGVTLVYKESLTQEDNFDIFDFYHGVPIAPFSQLETVLCNSAEELEAVKSLVTNAGLEVQVSLVDEWYDSLKGKPTT